MGQTSTWSSLHTKEIHMCYASSREASDCGMRGIGEPRNLAPYHERADRNEPPIRLSDLSEEVSESISIPVSYTCT